jgi:hypothetical protein
VAAGVVGSTDDGATDERGIDDGGPDAGAVTPTSGCATPGDAPLDVPGAAVTELVQPPPKEIESDMIMSAMGQRVGWIRRVLSTLI